MRVILLCFGLYLASGNIVTKHPPHASAGVRDATEATTTIEQNVRAIKTWEQQLQRSRSTLERFYDWITAMASRAPVLISDAVWFGG